MLVPQHQSSAMLNNYHLQKLKKYTYNYVFITAVTLSPLSASAYIHNV